MNNIEVSLKPLVRRVNLPTVLKTAILPGENQERLFFATQVGEIYYLNGESVATFLDIRPLVLKLGAFGGYDERGLLGLAFHPHFNQNGLFYLHYSVASSQGLGAKFNAEERQGLPEFYFPNPCNEKTFNLQWTDRNINYDHIDTVEEWHYEKNQKPEKRRTILNLRRPFFNHNGVNSLNFSPESGKLILTTGDGGSGYDPFNLSQNDLEIAGKIIEIDLEKFPVIENMPTVSRFDELPINVQEALSVMAKGVRNIPGISFQKINGGFVKYVGNVGQDLVEALYSFKEYESIPVRKIVQNHLKRSNSPHDMINFGWRGWEGLFPAAFIQECENKGLEEKIIAYYKEAINLSAKRLLPLTEYYHQDPRPNKFSGTALTGVQVYMGEAIPELKGKVIFTDILRKTDTGEKRGVLAYTENTLNKPNDYQIIEIKDVNIAIPALYVSLGSNHDQTKIYLGTYESMNVQDKNKGIIFELVQ